MFGLQVPSVVVTPQFIAAMAGAALSLIFSFVPLLNTKFAALPPEYKRLIMLGALILVAGSIYGLGCAGLLITGLICGNEGIVQLIWILFYAIIANQSTYSLTPLPDSVKRAASGLDEAYMGRDWDA